MSTHSSSGRRRSSPGRNGDRRHRRVVAIPATAVGLALGLFVLSVLFDQRAPSPNGVNGEVGLAPSTAGPAVDAHPDGEQLQAPNPTGVRVPAIGVDASTIPLGLRSDGAIEVPEDFQQTGWWKDGPEPGEIGPAVILGHVDSYEGPAVFYELDGLSVGDPIHIDRADGSTVTYVVERIEQHPKDDFPTAAVYGPTDESELRLVTCGGTFDRAARSYRDNVIVFAVTQA